MKNFLIIKDLVSFKFTKEDQTKIKDDYAGAFKPLPPGELHPTGMGMTPGTEVQGFHPQGKGLFAEIAASHSGIVTSNNKMYLPERMSEGVATFTKNYNKPVLLHHDDNKDPVGRIVSADYVDTSGSVLDRMTGAIIKDSAGAEFSLNSQVVKDFAAGLLPEKEELKVIDYISGDHFIKDIDSSYTGMGYAKIVANILDKDAIEKILDGRYLTGSVGLRTDKAVCSICHQDWVKDSLCEHQPGATYDGAKSFLITGNLFYDEYSFVNSPADKNSQVLELHYNDKREKIEIEKNPDRIHDVRMSLSFTLNSKENELVKNSDTKSIEIKDTEVVTDSSVTEVKEEVKITSIETEVKDSSTEVKEEVIVTSTELDIANSLSTESAEKEEIEKEFSLDSFGDYSVEDESDLYSIVSDLMHSLVKDGKFSQEDLDASLLTKDMRKELPKSAFCGPLRSLPVTDKIHVAATKILVSKISDELEVKQSIIKTLDRKAKALNYIQDEVTIEVESETNNDSNVARELMRSILDVFSGNTESVKVLDPEGISMLQKVLSRLALLSGKDAFEETLNNIGFVTNEKEEVLLLDQIEKQEEEMGSLHEVLNTLKDEYSSLYSDVESLQDSLVKEKVCNRSTKEDYLNLLTSLKNRSNSDSCLKEISDSDLTLRISEARSEIKLEKVLDKIDDGMSRIPTETAKSPVEDMNFNTEEKRQFTVSDMKNMEVQYWSLCYSRGLNAAQAYLQNIKQSGNLPTNNS